MDINQLWFSTNEKDWLKALDNYWNYVKLENLQLEKEMENLDPYYVKGMEQQELYSFLLNKYFRWKYTAKNRYATTTNSLKKYKQEGELEDLDRIKERIFTFNKENIKEGLTIKIRGLGIAWQSGLLSLLFPKYFGTVDQFAVKALRNIEGLPERNKLLKINAENLKINDGIILIDIMRQKSIELKNLFENSFWIPRKIDKILWSCRG